MQRQSVACIVIKDKKLLIAHRKEIGQMGGRWEFPGGKVEAGEDAPIAIVREMQEEFGIKAIPKEKITQISFIHDKESVSLLVYRVDFPHTGKAPDPPFTLSEHTGYAWVDTREILGLDFVDSDFMLFPLIKSYVDKL